MNDVVRFEQRDGVGLIIVDNPPVNALSAAVRSGLVEAVRVVEDSGVGAAVLSCEGHTFIAGADISEFGKPMADPHLRHVIDRIEGCSVPIIAAIHGTALGGGFEVALGCHYRCAVASAKVGQPEVHLGLTPGAGGTQRLPRAIGVEAATDMIVSGKPMPAPKAAQAGGIDRIVEGDLVQGAIDYARELIAQGATARRLKDHGIPADTVPDGFFADYRNKIARRTRGFLAPEMCIQAIEAAVAMSFEDGMAKEREVFQQCLASSESKAQRHLFFAERTVAKIPDIPKDTPLRKIERVAVIGAGTMGGGISMNFANRGIPVTILELAGDALERGLEVVKKNYTVSMEKGRLTQEEVDKRVGLLEGTLEYSKLGDADLIIEAVFESMDVKREVFAKLDEVAKPGSILATNTSSLDVNEIAAATRRPQDVIGLHFFSPANVMRLLEVVRADSTAKDVVATCMKLAKSIGKVGVLSGVCFGFIGNRMLEPYLREVNMLLLEGALPEQIDKAIYDFGFAMGPCAVGDLAGIDVGYKVRQARSNLPDDERYYRISDLLAEMGRHGQKTGAGFYRYEPGSRAPVTDPEVVELIKRESERLSVERRNIDDREIVDRCMFALINEAASILDEGIALRPVDVDVVYVTGYGFPVYRGGPMFYADSVGVKEIRRSIEHFAERLGNEYGYWTPSPLLVRLAEQGKAFGSLTG